VGGDIVVLRLIFFCEDAVVACVPATFVPSSDRLHHLRVRLQCTLLRHPSLTRKGKLMIRFVVGVLLLVMTPLASSAEEPSAEVAYVAQTHEVQARLYVASYQRFGKQLRATAILEACGKTGVAKSVAVSPIDETLFLYQEMYRKNAWSDKNFAFLRDLTSKERGVMFMAVRDQLLVYQMGYSEAVSLVKAQLPVLCDVGVRMADDLLKKGSAK
jgi:hypothetical protein